MKEMACFEILQNSRNTKTHLDKLLETIPSLKHVFFHHFAILFIFVYLFHGTQKLVI